ncbi:hypothetical protein [Sporocytophaga sp.]|uniref:hypothetical protein n=1 Tax=Sporocytophaga sp. TaxID=2231183 RepID=UPI0025E042C1|nr:hypothetical protein [Sporocytophaga sp.]
MSFGINRKKSIQQIHCEYTFGSIRTSFSPLAPIHLFRMNYFYLRKVVNNDRYSFYAGFQLNGQSWTVNYFPEMQAPKYGQVRSYLWAFSLDAAAHFEYKINSRSRLKLAVSAPVCALVNRPHFLDGSSDNSQFGLFNYWNPRIHLAYEYDVSNRISLFINYNYEYLQYAQPKTIRMLNNNLFIGIKLKF